jgi:tetratricopeptide (TPR) repeat protein
MKRLVLSLSLLIASVWAFAQKAEDVFAEGTAKMQEKAFKEAIEKFDLAVMINPNYEQAYMQRGLARKALLQFNLANQDFSKVLELNPKSVEANFENAFALSQFGKENDAIPFLQKAIELDPKKLEAYIELGNIYRKNGKGKEAIEQYEKAIKIDPKYEPAYLRLAIYHFNIEQHQKALQEVNHVITKINPKSAEAYALRGEIELGRKQYILALKDFNKAIELDAHVGSSYTYRGLAHFHTGKKKEACADWQKAHELGDFECEEYLEKHCAKK